MVPGHIGNPDRDMADADADAGLTFVLCTLPPVLNGQYHPAYPSSNPSLSSTHPTDPDPPLSPSLSHRYGYPQQNLLMTIVVYWELRVV